LDKRRVCVVSWCALAALLFWSAPSFAQSTASISGTVKDAGGGVIPGAAVVVKNEATGNSQETVSDKDGAYQVTALGAGTYTVTASLSGFKTAVQRNVSVAPGQPVNIPLTLEVGSLSETVTVTSSSELINTQTATVAATLNSDQLLRMPTPTRNALNAVAFLPGINTAGTNRDSTINGLPETFVSITLDGVSNNDNFLRNTDSFFASVTPRQDAVEAVSVTLAAAGANVGGGAGAVTMAFTTRSGGNKFTGSAYEYYRNPNFNSNYIFNTYNKLPKNNVKLHTFGARAGGPIVIPGLYDGRNKAFFFGHFEEIKFPNTFTRTRTVFNPRVLDGWYRYQVGTTTREVNLLDLARTNGQLATTDPTMMKIYSMTESAMKTGGTRSASSDPLYDSYVWQSPSELIEYQPTVRLDYNLSNNHRLSGSWSQITAKRTPDYLNSADPRFPGAPNQRDFKSVRPLLAISLRSTLGKNIVNELRGGATAFGSGSYFGQPAAVASRNDPSSFADTNGFAISTPNNTITDWFTSNGPSWRGAPTYSLDETLTWQKNAHTITAGGSVLISNASSSSQQMVRGLNIGFNTDVDPSISMFNTANFPNASSAQLTAAQNTYAMLTGRVLSVASQAVLDASGKYIELGPVTQEGGINVYGSFIQDSWRLNRTVTLTGGLRYDVQTPFKPFSSVLSTVSMESACGQSGLGDGGLYSKCNFLQPGATGGATPIYEQLSEGTEGYKTDWNNFAPSASIAWRPDAQDGFWRTLLGDPNQATVRAGYSEAYDRAALTTLIGVYGGNRGGTISLTNNANTGLGTGGAWPVLVSETNRLVPQPFNPDPSYPIGVGANRSDSLNLFAPDIKIARVRSWNIGIARSLSKDMAVEIRYTGNRGDNEWSQLNYNCANSASGGCTSLRGENLVANGFLNEFKLAMANLQANNASGAASRAGSFAYFGSGTGTSPLPIYLAYLNGSGDFGNPAAYANASTTWANATIAGRLAAANPNPNSAAGDLDGNVTRSVQAQRLGYPANFFALNPKMRDVNVTDSGAFSKYNAMQIELRRRLSGGLSANINYQYAFAYSSSFDGFSFGRAWTDGSISGNDVRHAIKWQADWQLPFGRGQHYGSGAGRMKDLAIGGWSVSAVGRSQRQVVDLGNVRLVGMSKGDLQGMYKFYTKDPSQTTTGITEIWMLPDDVILNTRRAFSTSNTTPDGYSASLGAPTGRFIAPANSASCIQIRAGDCAPRTVQLLAPWFNRVDFAAMKQIAIAGQTNLQVRFELLNLFDSANFTPVGASGTNTAAGTSATIFKTTSAYTDASNTYDPGGRIGMLSVRFNW